MSLVEDHAHETRLPRVLSRVVDLAGARALTRQGEPLQVCLGSEVSIGREGALRVGCDPLDVGVSRTALVVLPDSDGWHISCRNQNGIGVHPWAQAASWLPFGGARTLSWPRVALRVVGNLRPVEHWVLLEHDGYRPVPGEVQAPQEVADTHVVTRPRGLSPAQLTAVYAVFSDHLAWPPKSTPAARSLESVGHRIGVTPSAIRERLKPVQDRARELGLQEQVGVTDPAYVFHLAAYGYLEDVPPSAASLDIGAPAGRLPD